MIGVLGGALGAALLLMCVLVGGPAGLAYLFLWIAAALPGLPLGFLLFGRRHAAGWVAGALFGQVMTALAIWFAILIGATSLIAMLAVWLGAAVVAWLVTPSRPAPVVALPAWGRRDMIALLVFLWLVPLLAGPAFVNVGRVDANGDRLYRAYFTADFLWHSALTSELARFSMPPVNPYVASQRLHYYWTFFLLPAAAVAHAPHRWLTTEQALLVNATCAGVAFLSMLFVAIWAAVPRAGAALAAGLLAALASSAEGTFELWRLWRRGLSLLEVRSLNIDAITAWAFGGLRIDGLPRSLWYVPQHAAAAALGLVAMTALGVEGADSSVAAVWLSGIALGGAMMLSPVLGSAFSLVYAFVVLADGLRMPHSILRKVLRHACAAAPVALALAWAYANQVLNGTGGALVIGFQGLARNHPVTTLVLSLGPLLAAAVAGLALPGRWNRALFPGVGGLVVGLFLLYFVSMPQDAAYIGFRAGQVLLLTVPMLAARFFANAAAGGWRRAVVVGVGVALFAIGAPTTVIDAYNAQDVTNRDAGPGFQWTLVVTRDQQIVLHWIETVTPPRAVVQMDPIVRQRESWTFIPTFARRRMAAGLALPLLQQPEFAARSERVHEMYMTEDGQQACQVARQMRIDYVYVDDPERSAMGAAAIDKFSRTPECFSRVFRQGRVEIFAVVPPMLLRR